MNTWHCVHGIATYLDCHLCGRSYAAWTPPGQGPVVPPGYTCPAIDNAQRVMRRLAWRVKNRPETPDDEVQKLLREGLAILEQVRNDNKQMRDAYNSAKVRS